MSTIPYSRQSINQNDIDAVCSVFETDWLTQGPKVMDFEEALAHECGAKHCIVVANGTMALHLSCLALGVGPRDLGITSPITFLASANCIAYCGGRVGFVDIDPANLCLSVDRLEEYCQKNTAPKVVIPVDFAGIPAELPRLKSLAECYGFKIIEDAAHAIGSAYEYEGATYHCGSCAHTDLSIFSFHPVKTITAGEGGAVMTNDHRLAEKVRHLANHGVERDASRFVMHLAPTVRHRDSIPPWYYEMQTLGYNGRLTDIQCALGLSQLKRLEWFKEKRQCIVKKYNKAFGDLAEKNVLVLPPWPEAADPCYHLYPLRLGPNCMVHRDHLYQVLREKGIYCQIHYIPIYRQPFYSEKYHHGAELFPESEKYFVSCISLPLFPNLDDDQFSFIVDEMIALLKSHK